MSKKIFCFYQDKRGEWKRATQEMFNKANVVWKLYPYKQFHTEIINKDATKLWQLFDECLSHIRGTLSPTRKDYYKEPSGIYINGQQTPIAFGCGLLCEKLNKKYEVEWKPYKAIWKLYLLNPEWDEQFVPYEVKKRDGSKQIVVYVKKNEDIYCSNPDATYTQATNEFQDLNGYKVDDKDFVEYRLVEMNKLPKCPYRDYKEGCCSDCPFKNKQGCREKEWDQIQEEQAMNEERMQDEMMGSCSGCPYRNGCPVQDRYRCPEGF